MIAAESQAWRGLRRLQRLLHCAMLRVYCDEYRFMAATRIIKKYPNRRLYDTEISSYITIEDVRQLILDGEDFEVRDAKSGDDLTRSVLLQIIADQEQDGEPMLSTQLLSQLIRFYGDSCRASWAITWSAACRSSSTSSSSSASRWATCWGRPHGR